MPKPSSQSNTLLIAGMMVTVVALVATAILWWQAGDSIPLNDDQYATTMALYRVCNQRSVEGLDRIEELMEAEADSNPSSRSVDAIQSIIDDARAEQWDAAMERCRELLNDQVQYK